jgi:alpha-ketoglutaric semialdehyde dehydrogenase
MSPQSINPHSPSDIVHEFEPAGSDAVARAVVRARDQYPEWSRQPAQVRGVALNKIADDLERHVNPLVDMMVREIGKPIVEARAELARAVSIFRYFSQAVLMPDGATYPAPDGQSLLAARRFPLGVCGLITPWNFPVAIPSWKAAPAIGFGNSVVLKPAPQATATADLLTTIISRYLPEGVFQMLPGGKKTGEALVRQPDVVAVSFTGSVVGGRAVAQRCIARGARAQCEMGGQNPSIVLADANLARAATTIALAAMGYAGQKCTATSRIIVEESVYDQFRVQIIEAVERLGIENPASESCAVGPLIGQGARNSAADAIASSSGRVLTGGEVLESEGFYLRPTLVEINEPSDLLVQEEIFAPVAALLKAGSVDQAVAIANDVRYGLVASVFTSDLEQAITVLPNLEAGLVRVNASTTGVDLHTPFGGSKASSVGPREQGDAARDFYTESRTLQLAL